MNGLPALPGFLAGPPDLRVSGSGLLRRQITRATELVTWGQPAADPTRTTVAFSPVIRTRAGALTMAEVDRRARRDPGTLIGLLPPFAAVTVLPGGLRFVADSMGFRAIYVGTDRSAVSSSALALGAALSGEHDRAAVAVQSLLGWQLGERTLFDGVRKLPAGAVGELGPAGIAVQDGPSQDTEPIEFEDAVRRAAGLLRDSLGALLDEHPDAVLQLTGGMDSRLLLSAVPVVRRREMRAMTLAVAGSGDVATASAIADRYGMQHEVRGLADLESLDPRDLWDLCSDTSMRLDAMADPVALAAQQVAEQTFAQGVRISGLGGEIARGFYYLGRVVERPYTRADAVRLADWRMFVNESVEPGLLTTQFASWSREIAHEAVYEALQAGGPEWLRATDWLYLRHRMQRWAGATDVAVSNQRTVINPMLDPEFLSIAGRLRPDQKRGARFLAAVQMELDSELGRMPLDGRPAPAFFADPPRHASVLNSVGLARKVGRKVVQRVRCGNRPPAGGQLVASKVVEHWRSRPELLEPLAAMDFIDQDWVSRMLASQQTPQPSSVAFLTNLIVSSRAPAQRETSW